MSKARLNILYVSPMPPSPPRFGAQARMHGLGRALAARHDVTGLSLVDEGFDAAECEQAMRAYCRDVTLVSHRPGGAKRLEQLYSLFSRDSYQRRRFAIPGLQDTLDRVLASQPFDLVFLHFPYLAHYRLRQAPPGHPAPALVIDSHDIGYDLARQVASRAGDWSRRLFAAFNWRKLEREERAAYEGADGVCVCSRADQARLAQDVPAVRTAVIPNAADIDFLRPRADDPPPDGRTVLFFGLLSTVPNVDGVSYFLREVWPAIAAARKDARVKIVGAQAGAAMRALAGPRVELTGVVDDLRPHLAAAAVVVVPLRLGSGTRLKIVEAWAMAKPIVSTTLGAEGIDAVPGRDIMIADEPRDFAAAVTALLADPGKAAEMGRAGRRLAEERYSWPAAGEALDRFIGELREGRKDRGNHEVGMHEGALAEVRR